ncbi:hypothetical protein OEZ85_004437 [Tetradesmus obliquus]|uniref:SART-1 family protein n=1 Tax=Tetradesmus obliquus TaxID=3088 RepID=A0ABY8ULD9_TETOB|nr:hypothetical protein OEZ85_004437 [Tetradesmus obliquus]
MADEVVELSIEETNRLRASLGLKPLSSGPPAAAKLQPKPEAKPEVDADELRSKLQDKREKRRREAELRKTKTLGEASADVDDVASWISKIKPGQAATADAAAAAAAAGGKPAKRARRGDAKAAAAAGDEAEHTAADLAGVSVKHNLGDLAEGETVVLTLADAGILDEKGELADGPDQLVDVLSMQEKARRKARAAATKTAKPLWEEDGKIRGLLDKYDEEEEEAAAAFDAAGQLHAQQRREEELRKRLAAGKALLAGNDPAGGAGGLPASSDYYTAEEAAAMKGGGKEKKKKKRKLRTTKVSADEEPEAAAGLDLDALEAAAAAEGAADLGSRDAREQRRKDADAARAAAQADRAARFEAALGRANIASEALRPSKAAAAAADEGSDDADDELAASLARARRLAQKAAGGSGSEAAAAGGGSEAAAAADAGDAGSSSFEEMAKQLAKKREEDEAKLREQLAAGTTDAFTETTEFVRSIQVTGPKAAEDGSSYMDVDEPAAAAAAAPLPPPPAEVKPPAAAKQQRKYRKGGWVAADGQEDEEQQADAEADAAAASSKRPAPELEDTGVVGERAIGKGLAACLGLLKDKGTLKNKMQWAGRTNDKKPVALIGLHDVYTGGSHEDAMSQRIEVALTQRDEFGRVMTPKERFRVMCHQFHGKPPSKNKQEERQRKYLEEVAIAKATTSEDPSAELDRLKALQRSTGSAYIPLTGKGRLGVGGSRGEDPLSGLATARSGAGGASVAPTPVLGGGLTPLSGVRKVEAMLGISKPGGSSSSGKGSMLPPAPRK